MTKEEALNRNNYMTTDEMFIAFHESKLIAHINKIYDDKDIDLKDYSMEELIILKNKIYRTMRDFKKIKK